MMRLTQKLLKTLLPCFALLSLSLCVSCSQTSSDEHGHPHDDSTKNHSHDKEEKHSHDPMLEEEDHPHNAPHGGKVRTVSEDRHLELFLTQKGEISVYVLDGESQQISAKGAEGKIKFLLGKEVKMIPLVYDAEFSYLKANTEPFSQDEITAIVEVTQKGKLYNARFSYRL